jgi:pimeloyl-ACP methyl ester carboxylesterase
MTELADDIAVLLDHLSIEKAHAVIGVSQGGAAALQFVIRHPGRATCVVACDTQAKSPEANIKAWDDRIDLAKKHGMNALATATADRWFPSNSAYHSSQSQANFVLDMIVSTPLLGFEAGARALQGYDLLADGLLQSKSKILLVAGEKDGVLPKGLKLLREDWLKESGNVEYAEVENAGHLPMVDEAERWLEVVVKFLKK